MLKRTNTRTLLLLFIILTAIFAVVLLSRHQQKERSFRAELFGMDTASVTAVIITPPDAGKGTIRLERSTGEWEVITGDSVFPADTTFIRTLMQILTDSKPERVAGVNPSAWSEFEVTDSTGTQVVVMSGNEVVADFRAGKISFSQPAGQQGFGRNQQPVIKSHVRVAGDDRVYVVDGFLSLMFSRDPQGYRQKQVPEAGKVK